MQISSPINLFLPQNSDEAPKEFRGYLQQLYNSLQLLQLAFNTYAGAAQWVPADWSTADPADSIIVGNMGRLYAKATEDIAYGAVVSAVDAGAGVLGIRNANATDNTRPAIGWCSLSTGIASGAYGECIVGPSLCDLIGGLTMGARYFLNTTNGQIVNAEPAGAGNIGQALGIALGPSRLLFNPSLQWVQH